LVISTDSFPEKFRLSLYKLSGYMHGTSRITSVCPAVQLKRDGTRRRAGVEVKGNLANGLCSQYSSHYLGTWCIQHYYRWCAHLSCQLSTELTPAPI